MLTMKAKYALRALSALAQADGARLQARTLAERSGTPEKFLEAILVELRDAGLVDSRRGPTGGHALAKPAARIMLGDVIRVIDGPLAPVRCASVTAYKACPECPDPDACGLRAVMREARDALSQVLDGVSVQALASGELLDVETPA
ncbi:RrF2 family transcriptional regulator [Lysobacter sp. HA18]